MLQKHHLLGTEVKRARNMEKVEKFNIFQISYVFLNVRVSKIFDNVVLVSYKPVSYKKKRVTVTPSSLKISF